MRPILNKTLLKTKKDISAWLSKKQSNWNLDFPPYTHVGLSNGIEVYSLKTASAELCYCELIFENGRIHEHKQMVARFTAIMLQEGTEDYNSAQVADFFDYYGASYSIHADLDFTSISFSCLQKFFAPLLEFVIHLITNPSFRQADLDRCKKFIKSQLKHQLAEPDFVSYREFTASIFGANETYGYNTSIDNIDAITLEDLHRYHQENYVSTMLKVFFCGNVEVIHEAFWQKNLGSISVQNQTAKRNYKSFENKLEVLHFPMEYAAQTSLKLGCKMFSKINTDFYPLYFINTILGDYFGSRLMKNIREDKGFTYDIHSTLDAQLHDGCFYISAELNQNELSQTLDEIKKELNRLHTEPIAETELLMVKNYLHGHLQRLLDGSFQSILFLKILVSEYHDAQAYKLIMDTIHDIDAKQIMDLSKRYLNYENMTIITAGVL